MEHFVTWSAKYHYVWKSSSPYSSSSFQSQRGLSDVTPPLKKTLVAISNNTQWGRLITELPVLSGNALPVLPHYLPTCVSNRQKKGLKWSPKINGGTTQSLGTLQEFNYLHNPKLFWKNSNNINNMIWKQFQGNKHNFHHFCFANINSRVNTDGPSQITNILSEASLTISSFMKVI